MHQCQSQELRSDLSRGRPRSLGGRPFFATLASLKVAPHSAESTPPLLEPGNSKLGTDGRFAETVFVWNLPAMATCPGASKWCSAHCYNADALSAKFPIEPWAVNWAWATERPIELEAIILARIKAATPPIAFRIHSSGDFFSTPYVALWITVCRASPDVCFWAYTRSWQIPEIAAALEELRRVPNVELFASWDNSMQEPPPGWRLSTVLDGGSPQPSTASTLQCPEEDGRVANCADCGYCFSRRSGNVSFSLH